MRRRGRVRCACSCWTTGARVVGGACLKIYWRTCTNVVHIFIVVVDRSGSRSNYQSSSSLSSSSSSSSLRKSNSLTMPGLAAISAILPPPAAAFAAHCKIAALLRQCKNYCELNKYASENCAHRKLSRARTPKGRLLDT